MAGTATVETETLSQDSRQDSWADLANAEPTLAPAQQTEDRVPGTQGICPVCNEPIIREPGSRGRLPKYHPACKPVASGRSTGTRRTGSAKAEQEAELCVAQFKSYALKGIIMVAAVDRFDAFALMVSLPEFCSNLKGVLVRYEKFRKEWLAASGGGSIVGLLFITAFTALPILAHHGMLGKNHLAAALVNTPQTMYKIQQQLKDGEANLTKLMAEQVEAMNGNKRRAPTQQPQS